METIKRLIQTHQTSFLLIGITLVGAFLRLYNLGGKSLFDDETFYWERAIFMSQGGSYDAVIDWNVYMQILKQIVRISQTEFALRLPSAIAGIFSIPLMFLLASRLVGSKAALMAAGLFAVNPFLLIVGQMVREHSLYLLFVIALNLSFLRYLEEGRIRDLLGLIVFSLLALFSHISSAWIMLALGLTYAWSLWAGSSTAKTRLAGMTTYGTAIVIAGVFFWLSGFNTRAGWGLEGYTEWGYYWRGTFESFLQVAFGNTWSLLEGMTNERSVLALVLSLFLAFYIGWRNPANRTMFLISLLPWLITIGTAMISFYPFIGIHRNNIYLLVGVFILSSFGFSAMARMSKPIFSVVFSLLLILLVRDSWLKLHQPSPEEFRPVAQRLCELVQPEDQIFVADVATRAMAYYWPRCESPYAILDDQAIALQSFAFRDPQLAAALREGEHNVWIVLTFLNNNEYNRLLGMLDSRLGRKPILVHEEHGAWLYRLAPP